MNLIIAPIIYSLVSNGVNPEKIYYTDYFIDKTTLNLKNDPRLKFLIKFNINFSQTFFNNYYKIVNKKKNYALKKIIKFILYLLIINLFLLLFCKNIKNYLIYFI